MFGPGSKPLEKVYRASGIIEGELGDWDRGVQLFERGASVLDVGRGPENSGPTLTDANQDAKLLRDDGPEARRAALASIHANRGAMLWHAGKVARAREWLGRAIDLF